MRSATCMTLLTDHAEIVSKVTREVFLRVTLFQTVCSGGVVAFHVVASGNTLTIAMTVDSAVPPFLDSLVSHSCHEETSTHAT